MVQVKNRTDRRPVSIRVAGDPTVDWLLVVPDEAGDALPVGSTWWERGAPIHLTAQPGGAALLRALLDAASRRSAEAGGSIEVGGADLAPAAMSDPGHSPVARAFSVWQPHPLVAGSTERAWRMLRFLGHQSAVAPDGAGPAHDLVGSDVLVVDDTNLGARGRPLGTLATARADALPRQVIVKMTNPIAQGTLWNGLVERLPERLTLYVSLTDLRRELASIGQSLSWESLASQVVTTVAERPDLRRGRRLVVSVGYGGAVVFDGDARPVLVYDPQHQEEDWHLARPGVPTGLGSGIVAALALGFAAEPEAPDAAAAVETGLRGARLFHERGLDVSTGDGGAPRLPIEATAAALATGPADEFERAEIPSDPDWRIFCAAAPVEFRQLAERIAIEGEGAARGMPVERMGGWSSMDRTEIESVRSVRSIIREYLAQERRTRPLSIAVFGPPGSGKSFAIKEMARGWASGAHRVSVLEFNLSQFASPDELAGAFQRVRDGAVEQKLPLVFWDEFDAKVGGVDLGWLVRFLAPMQDGAFVERGTIQPIGPAIFVFAGGTHATMAAFKARAMELPGAKATDFLSRLRGYVDVLGPNRAGAEDETAGLRRALLLRSLLRMKAPALFAHGRLEIDPGVLRAFLGIDAYLHGARSMESIIDMSALSGRRRFERSSLPAPHQLDLHVDAGRFLGLVQG